MLFHSKKDPDSVVEVIAFNYDGKGSVLYHYKDAFTVYELSLQDLQDKLLGKLNGEEAEFEILNSD